MPTELVKLAHRATVLMKEHEFTNAQGSSMHQMPRGFNWNAHIAWTQARETFHRTSFNVTFTIRQVIALSEYEVSRHQTRSVNVARAMLPVDPPYTHYRQAIGNGDCIDLFFTARIKHGLSKTAPNRSQRRQTIKTIAKHAGASDPEKVANDMLELLEGVDPS